MRRHVAFDLCRTMLALCALYALVVQGFVGGAEAASGRSLAYLCGHDGADPDSSNLPAGHQQACCVAGCFAGSGAMPFPGDEDILPLPRVAMTVDWRSESAQARFAQPWFAFHPRGPPRV